MNQSYDTIICVKTAKTITLETMDSNWEVVFVLLSVLDSCLRFPLLCMFHKQYRRALLKIFSCCKKKKSEHTDGSPPYKPAKTKRSWIKYRSANRDVNTIYMIQQRAHKLQQSIKKNRNTNLSEYGNKVDYEFSDSQYANPRYIANTGTIAVVDGDIALKDSPTEGAVRSYVTNPLATNRGQHRKYEEDSYYGNKHKENYNTPKYSDDDLYSTDQESIFSFHPARPNVRSSEHNDRISYNNPDITFSSRYKDISGAEMSESWI